MENFETKKVLSPWQAIIYITVIAVGIALDQLTKLLAVLHLAPMPGKTLPIIEGVFHFTYCENTGMAFSLLSGENQRWIFIVVSTITLAALAVYLFIGQVPNKLYLSGILLILSGGIGNMIDRIALGYVVDFIDVRLINFAVFNIADSFVTVGAGVLIAALIVDIVKETRKERREK